MALQSLAIEVSIVATDVRSLYCREDGLRVLFSRVSGLRGHYCKEAILRSRYTKMALSTTVEGLTPEFAIIK